MFDARDWYWLADDGRLYASARQQVVAVEDATYMVWLGPAGAPERGPTRWPHDDAGLQTDAALQDVLTPYGLYLGLSEIKAALKAAIDEAAERERLKYITGGAGQAMEYQQAATEAGAFLAAAHPTDPPAGTYPMLEAGVGIDGETLSEVATVVATMFARWQVVGSAIRAVRLAAKQAIDMAETAEDALAVQARWPTP